MASMMNPMYASVTYVWSIGGFLFIEPPSVFQFLSLQFSYPANNLTNITLTLPHQCRGLVSTANNDNCSCANDGNTLDILTQQVNLSYSFKTYARIEPVLLIFSCDATARGKSCFLFCCSS